ncbi:MAG: hypothetical protein IPK79_10615 [Vampirovibrionales bacterium]|nr:hypothetical protein [Vampirovibrionales bacterium]
MALPVVGKLTNCRRCNKIFRLLRSAYCPDCMTTLEVLIQRSQRVLVCQPETLLEDLSRLCQMSQLDAEILFFDGLLGPGAAHVLIYCKRCGKTQNNRERKGRYCADCAALVDEEHKAQHARPAGESQLDSPCRKTRRA